MLRSISLEILYHIGYLKNLQLLPLAALAGCISKDRAARIVESLENEHRFGPAYRYDSSTWFTVVSANRYWQGPTWINTNWLIIDGLKRYGFHDHAEALKNLL